MPSLSDYWERTKEAVSNWSFGQEPKVQNNDLDADAWNRAKSDRADDTTYAAKQQQYWLGKAEESQRHAVDNPDAAFVSTVQASRERAYAQQVVEAERTMRNVPGAEQDRANGNSVRLEQEGSWQVGQTGVQRQIDIGRSDNGYHFRISTEMPNRDINIGEWSPAHSTREVALDSAGRERQRIEIRERAPASPEQKAAVLLNDVRAGREMIQAINRIREPHLADHQNRQALLAVAREKIEQAREISGSRGLSEMHQQDRGISR